MYFARVECFYPFSFVIIIRNIVRASEIFFVYRYYTYKIFNRLFVEKINSLGSSVVGNYIDCRGSRICIKTGILDEFHRISDTSFIFIMEGLIIVRLGVRRAY